MSKLYEWLAIYVISPHKSFHDFIKCLDILFGAKQITEKEITEEKKRGKPPQPTYLAQPGQKPAQPTRGRVVFHPRPGRQLVAVASMPGAHSHLLLPVA